ncbi:MAG: hypothetical protein LBI44_02095 [Oscillospiraceae bacterium]|jgi:hypothetical protein|nr:hypothetical protein [Oscillospiraceae bacterium]
MDYPGIMTAEQAAEAAKGLTFEKVWAALMESRVRSEEETAKIREETAKIREEAREAREAHERKMEEMRVAHERKMEEMRVAHERKMEEENKRREEEDKRREEENKRREEENKQREEEDRKLKKAQKRTDKMLADLSRNIGGVENSLGQLVENMFAAGLCAKFRKLGYEFTRQSNNVRYMEKTKVITEVDAVLEDGEYIMLVEAKTKLAADYVNEHLERIETVRAYMDKRGDKRKIIGAVAGGVVPDGVLRLAQKQGLFVIVQSGDSAVIAAPPAGFSVRVW